MTLVATQQKDNHVTGMGPTIRARRLGQELRRLRLDAALSQEEAATRLHWNRLKVNRIEGIRTVPSVAETVALCELYGAGTHDASTLIQLTRDAKTRGWWTAYGDVFEGTYIADEDMAACIHTFQSSLIPGLLQTEDYARAVITAGRTGDSPDEIQRWVQGRMARRVLLTRATPPPPALTAVFDESVLWRPVGTPQVMATQLRHLLLPHPNVTIRVLPYTAGATAGLDGRWTMLEFPPNWASTRRSMSSPSPVTSTWSPPP